MADEKLIWVRSTIPTRRDGGNTVALYEADDAHPDGEAFVAGPEPVQVARTTQVHRLISDGTLEEVDAPKAEEPDTPARSATTQQTVTSTLPPADPLAFLSDEQRTALATAGFDSPEKIRSATDEQLDAVPGIGTATIERLREATKEG